MAKKGKAATTTSHFLVILRQNEGYAYRQIEVSKAVQSELVAEIESQTESFLTYRQRASNGGGKSVPQTHTAEEISFFPTYTLNDRSQIFAINNYTLDAHLMSAATSPDSVDDLRIDDSTIPLIKALCVVFPKPLKVYFQAFEKRRILSTEWWTFLQNGKTFSRLDRPGFTLGDQVHAIYDDGKLLFRSFAVASRFLNLLNLFNEASNEKVEEVLGHKLFHVADVAAVIEQADTVMRKQFAAISEMKTLDKVKPSDAKKTAAEYDIILSLSRQGGVEKIDFPPSKKEQKELLKFLTEGYYTGPLTGTKFESNSHRPKDSGKK